MGSKTCKRPTTTGTVGDPRTTRTPAGDCPHSVNVVVYVHSKQQPEAQSPRSSVKGFLAVCLCSAVAGAGVLAVAQGVLTGDYQLLGTLGSLLQEAAIGLLKLLK